MVGKESRVEYPNKSGRAIPIFWRLSNLLDDEQHLKNLDYIS